MKKNVIKIYKSGTFYNAFGDDGYIIHEVLGYKYVESKNGVGFPASAYQKVKNKLEELKLSYEVYEAKNLVDSFKGINELYHKYLKKALKNIRAEERISYLKEKIDNLSVEELEKLIEGIEDGISS